MKNIKQIFKWNPSLMEEPEVEELIEYCRELEDSLIESDQKSQYNKESHLLPVVSDIYRSVKEIINRENNPSRFDEEIDYKEAIKNLDSYLEEIKKIYSLRL